MTKSSRLILALVVIALCMGLDLSSKKWAVDNIQHEPPKKVMGDFFVLKFAKNKGAMLSLGANLPDKQRRAVMRYLTLIILIVLLATVIRKWDMDKGAFIALNLILAGGAANLIDRFTYDYVVDFMLLNFDFFDWGVPYLRTGIFNIADVAIMYGVFYWIYHEWTNKKNEKSQSEEIENEDQATGDASVLETPQSLLVDSVVNDTDNNVKKSDVLSE